ncbi:MAG: adenylosuccinate lyase [Methanomassiliicoccaceae archaeon]|nr:adenylosuccinate lyase [Methanomassiliicoccaceae archaeon]
MSDLCPLDYRYGRPVMKKIFCEDSRLQYQMDVEASLAKAHASLGTITKEDADEIVRISSLKYVTAKRVKEIEKETKHDLMAMVKAMTEQCNGNAGKYVHLGATSNDIVDTATALQIRDALKIISEDIDIFLVTLAKLAKKERDTIEIGRTHAQFAIPITFGFKISGYIAEMLRHKERIFEIGKRACAGKMAGAVGTGAALGKNFFRIQEFVMDDIGIYYEPAATQVVGRDRYTELICFLSVVATSLERYATEIRNLQRSELSEAAEAFDITKQVGSSTMAQKKNPITSENVCGLARVVRGFMIPAFESQVLWHERDLSNSSAERFILPHVFALVDDMLHKMNNVFANLSVNRDNMIRNIDSAKGLIMAESVMMKITEKGIGRQVAHEIIREASMNASKNNEHLLNVLLRNKELTKIMTEKEIRSSMDPKNYVGGSKEITDNMIKAVESALNVKI